MDHLINDNTQLSATAFLIELFDIFNLILDSIEFVDYVNIGQRWTEMFSKVVKFANFLEVRKVIQLKQKAESRINYVSGNLLSDRSRTALNPSNCEGKVVIFQFHCYSCKTLGRRCRYSKGSSVKSNKVLTALTN